MRKTCKTTLAAAITGAVTFGTAASWAADAPAKNWTAPSHKIYGQKLSDETMAKHPELLSITLHGTPPGSADAYTMFAGSFPERIGNPDDPDDIDVIKKGITIVDPRWHRTQDNPEEVRRSDADARRARREHRAGRVRLQEPAGESAHERGRARVPAKSTALRDELKKKIPSYGALFEAAK